MKHKIKLLLRELYARVLFHTGLHALVNRLMPRRLTVLFGHCVAQPDCNGFLPGDMKISDAKLGRIVDWFAQRYDFRPLSEAFDGVANGGARSAVALTMDDGYRDNATALLPLLRERGLAATIRATAASTAARTSSSQQISQASPSGPCSAWSTMSTATSSVTALASAMTTTSDGPAKLEGTPTRPELATSRLACATRALPGPTITSTGRIESVP